MEFSLSTSRLGRIQLPVLVRIIGSCSPPLTFVIEARSVGPVLVATCNGASTKSRGSMPVDFGRVHVLQEHSMVLALENTSVIRAEYKTFIEVSDSVFEVGYVFFCMPIQSLVAKHMHAAARTPPIQDKCKI